MRWCKRYPFHSWATETLKLIHDSSRKFTSKQWILMVIPFFFSEDYMIFIELNLVSIYLAPIISKVVCYEL